MTDPVADLLALKEELDRNRGPAPLVVTFETPAGTRSFVVGGDD